jgi:hypothetical protein
MQLYLHRRLRLLRQSQVGLVQEVQFKIFYCNARSLKNKFHELYFLLYGGGYNILCFTESWLSDMVSDGLLYFKSLFNIYRRDRFDGYGGAVIFSPNQLRHSR